MQLLENIRTWKNKILPDWLWDILVGVILGLIGLLTTINLLILAMPFVITVVNQFYNKLFEPKDFALRMILPIILYLLL